MENFEYPDIYTVKSKFILLNDENVIKLTPTEAQTKYNFICSKCKSQTFVTHNYDEIIKNYCPKCATEVKYEKILCNECNKSKIGCFCCGYLSKNLRALNYKTYRIYLCSNEHCLNSFDYTYLNFSKCICYITNFKKLDIHPHLKSIIKEYIVKDDKELNVFKSCLKCKYSLLENTLTNTKDICKC